MTVNFATTDGTAVAGTDYTAASGTVTFPANTTSQTISVGIMDNDNYTNQTVSFTVTLSQPANATLGSPSVSTVNILDNDPAPTADIEINGVAKAQKNNPGGYVQVNANNDNGSVLTYTGGIAGVPTFGVPQKRDFDPTNINLPKADPDIAQITLQTQNLKPGCPENVVLSVMPPKNPPQNPAAKIQIWDAGTKNNVIGTPTNWTVKTIPGSVYVEGLHESAVLVDTLILQLQILNNGKVVATDTCMLTVTPVLTSLLVTADPKGTPNLLNDNAPGGAGWILASDSGAPGEEFALRASAQWNNVNGKLRFIQNAYFKNNLPDGYGADLPIPALPVSFDFGGKNAGATLVDTVDKPSIPFYTLNEKPGPPGNVVTNSATDSPALPLNLVTNTLPGVGGKTSIDVIYKYFTYGTVAFNDNSIYCLGQQSWNVHYAGAVTQPMANGYQYAPAGGNGNTGGVVFGRGILNNTNPVAIGPLFGNGANLGWR